MKIWNLLVAFLIIALFTGCHSDEKEPEIPLEKGELSLYNQEKKSIAYIDYDDEATIYLWEGMPVAYLMLNDELNNEEKFTDEVREVYGFNGKCLGWYYDGVLYDSDGYAIGAKEGIIRGSICMTAMFADRPKGVKQVKHVKHAPYIAPARRVLLDRWSETSLIDFLKKGVE